MAVTERSIQAKVAAAAESPWNNSLPAKIANDLSTFAGGYLFLAFVVKESVISICNAGDLRLHMVVDSEITHVTRVHNLIEDVPPGIYDVGSLNSIQRMNVITRCLGQTTPAPPELLSWVLPPRATLVVVSSLVHRYDTPNNYVFALLHGDHSRLKRWEGLLEPSGIWIEGHCYTPSRAIKWEAATWIYAAIGDACFSLNNCESLCRGDEYDVIERLRPRVSKD
jgi:hypothetical protein